MEFVRFWCLAVEKYSISAAVVYIATDDNVQADMLSKGRLADFEAGLAGCHSVRVWPSSVNYFGVNV